MNSGFLDKFIERIGRVRPEEVQSYLLRLADEKGFLETIFNAIHSSRLFRCRCSRFWRRNGYFG